MQIRMNEGQCVCMHKYLLWMSFLLTKVLLETRLVNKEEGKKKEKDIWNSFNHCNSCFLMLWLFCSLLIFLTSLVPGNQFGKDRSWNDLLRKEPQHMKKGTSECSYMLEERVLKSGKIYWSASVFLLHQSYLLRSVHLYSLWWAEGLRAGFG